MTTATLTIADAVKLHQLGRLDEAEQAYRSILKVDPAHADALYLLGTVHLQRGKLGSAALFLKKALDARPDHLEAMNNLGLTCEEQGRLEEAETIFQKVARKRPKDADIHGHLGRVHHKQRRYEEAVADYRRAISIDPNRGDAHDGLGVALRELDRLEESIRCCHEAVRLDPKSSRFQNNLGAALKNAGRFAEAVVAFEVAAGLDPTSAVAQSNLGITSALAGDLASAEQHALAALQLDPSSPVGHNNLGLVRFLSGREADAVPSFARACALDPKFADAHNNLASALFRSGETTAALEHYRRSAELKPLWGTLKNLASLLEHTCAWGESAETFLQASTARKDDPVLALRSATVCPTVFGSTDDIADYRARLDAAIDRAMESDIVRDPRGLFDLDTRPSFAWQFLGWEDRPLRERYAKLWTQSFPEVAWTKTTDRPKVGFYLASGHEYAFRRSIAGLFPHFRRDDWRPVIVCSPSSQQKLVKEPDLAGVEFLTVPPDLLTTTDAIRSAKIDLLYHWEIATGPLTYLLPFCRPAPIQCTSWGIQVTSGIPAIDDYVSSRWVEAEDAEAGYTERLTRLDTLLSYQRPLDIPAESVDRSKFGLAADQHVYLCAQQLGKFHPAFDELLLQILDADGQGVLVVTESSHPAENAALIQRWTRTLGPVMDRVRFIPKQVGRDYAELIRSADVILDPTHFGGVNTTYDAISAGRVTVTMPGRWNKNRFTAGCHWRIGVADGVVDSAESYIRRAVAFGTDPDLRQSVEEKLIARRGDLFHSTAAAHELEDWFVERISRYRSTGP